MNVDAVYLGPVFESSEHGYDTIDYKKIDRRSAITILSEESANSFTITA